MNDRDIDQVLEKLRALQKAYDRLSRGVPDVQSAKSTADRIFNEVIELLSDRDLLRELNERIVDARSRVIEESEDFDRELEREREALIRTEAKLMNRAGVRKRDVEQLFVLYKFGEKHRNDFPEDAGDIKRELSDVHASINSQLPEVRSEPRKVKKRRKRDLINGAISAISGTTAIVANIKVLVAFPFSYALGSTALLRAIRDVVGELRD